MKKFKKFILILMAAAVFALGATVLVACNDKNKEQPIPEHSVHEWEEYSNTATCTEPGELTLKCAKGGETQTVPSLPLGHLWGENSQILTEPTCTTMGKGHGVCERCGTELDYDIDMAPHQLKPDFDSMQLATCTKPGLDVKKCKVCKQTFETVIPATGHDFTGKSETIAEATCETDGKRIIKCQNDDCDGDKDGNMPAVKTLTIPALGHEWESEPTLEREPTFTTDGLRSVHCLRCEKVQEGKDVVIPKLEEGKTTTYTIRLVRPNREVLKTASGAKITVKNGEEVVAESDFHNYANGVMTVDLLPKTYTVTVEGLPTGYSAQQSYTIELSNVEKDLEVSAGLLPIEDANSQTHYALGSVMHDYTFKDVHGNKTVTLGKLLQQKKIVLLNFFFVTCGACQSEMPGLLSAYELYKDDIAIVMLDVVNYDDTQGIINDFLEPFNVPDSVYVVQDMTPDGEDDANYNNICEKFKFNSAPQNIIIDKEGVVVYAETGATSEMKFRNLFGKYTSAPYYNEEDEPTDEPTEERLLLSAVLPNKFEF